MPTVTSVPAIPTQIPTSLPTTATPTATVTRAVAVPTRTPTLTPAPTSTPLRSFLPVISRPLPTLTPTQVPTPSPYNITAIDASLRGGDVPIGWEIVRDEWLEVSPNGAEQLKVVTAYFTRYGDAGSGNRNHFVVESQAVVYLTEDAAISGLSRAIADVSGMNPITVPPIGDETAAFKIDYEFDGLELEDHMIIFREGNVRVTVSTTGLFSNATFTPTVRYAELLQRRIATN